MIPQPKQQKRVRTPLVIIVVAIATLLSQCGWHDASAQVPSDSGFVMIDGVLVEDVDIAVVADSIGAGMAASMKPVRFMPNGNLAGDFDDNPAQIIQGPWPNCPQVLKAWPFRLANQTGKKVVNLSCGGATTSDMLNGSATRPPQISDPRLKTAETVLVMAGANNIKFADGLVCMVTQFPCTETDLPQMFSALKQLQADLVQLLNAIRQVNPQAQLRLVGYPTLFAENSQLNQLLCPGIQPEEVALSLKAQSQLVEAGLDAVAEVKAAGGNVEFFNPRLADPRIIPTDAGPMIAVSDACTDSPARIITSITNSVKPQEQVVHPNDGGHQWYADLIQEDLGLAG